MIYAGSYTLANARVFSRRDDHGDGQNKEVEFIDHVGYALWIDLVVLIVGRLATRYIILVKFVSFIPCCGLTSLSVLVSCIFR